MPMQRIPTRRRLINISLNEVFTLGEFEIRFDQPVVMGERRAADVLAIGAVAEDGAFVLAIHGVLHGLAEAGTCCCHGGFGGCHCVLWRECCCTGKVWRMKERLAKIDINALNSGQKNRGEPRCRSWIRLTVDVV